MSIKMLEPEFDYYILVKQDIYYLEDSFFFLLILQKKETKKKRPQKPTSIFSFTQKISAFGRLKKWQFALFVDVSRTVTNFLGLS
jgi:hypothetical protein